MNSEIDYDAVRERVAALIGDEKPYPWAKRLGLSQATWNRFWSKKDAPKVETLYRIAQGSGVTIDFLIHGKGGETLAIEAKRQPVDVVSIPVLNIRASAGPGALGEDGKEAGFIEIDRSLMLQLGLRAGETAVLTIQGDSAIPTLSDGDRVLVDLSNNHPQDGLLYVIGVDTDLVVKRIQRMVDGSLLLKSDNPSYEAQRMTSADAASLRIIGRVKYALRAV